MKRFHLGRWTAAIVGAAVGTLAATATPAAADTLTFTDPAGDVHVVADPCFLELALPGVIDCNSASPIAEPTIDLEGGALTAGAESIVASLTVVDLDGPTTFAALVPEYSFQFAAPDGIWVDLSFQGDSGAQIDVFNQNPAASVTRPVAGFSTDTATNTVQWEVSLDLVNEMIAELCATCSPLGAGSVLGPGVGSSSRQTPTPNLPVLSDRAVADGSVVVG